MPRTRSRVRRGVLCGLLFTLASLAGCADNEPISSQPAFLVPQDYPTIQAGIDAATPGSVVLVEPGLYTHLETRYPDHPEFPRGVRAAVFMRSDIEVKGNGPLGSVVVRDTTRSDSTYGALFLNTNDSAWLDNFDFEDFHIGAAVVGSTGVILRSRFAGSAAGIWLFKSMEPAVVGNLVENCEFDGILNQISDSLIWQNIVRNCAAGVGAEFVGLPLVVDNILCSNQVGFGTNEGAQALLQYNAIFNNSIAGVLTAQGARPVVVENDLFDNGVDYWIGFYEDAIQDSLIGRANYWGTADTSGIATNQIRDLRTDPESGGYLDYLPVSPGSVFRLGVNPQVACAQGMSNSQAARRRWVGSLGEITRRDIRRARAAWREEHLPARPRLP